MRQSNEQMTLGELIDVLKRKDRELPITFDFVFFKPNGNVYSYRGYYEDLAIGYKSDGECTVGQLLDKLEQALGDTFYGWKGGEYTMERNTVLWVANAGESGGTAIVDVVDDRWRILLVTKSVD